ncbi:MAG: hypothetical protein NTV52_08105 [Acidobacteria bacterium]|nr:hypothetical protein [Acidobacteriota bacterium]
MWKLGSKYLVAQERAVLDGRATGHYRGHGAFAGMGMDESPLAQFLRLAADGFNLSGRHRLPAAIANALGRKQLDRVGSLGHALPHQFADLVRRSVPIREGVEGTDEPWPRDAAAFNRRPEFAIGIRAEALHGGESGRQRRINVRRTGDHVLGR